MSSINKAIAELQQFMEDVQAGAYIQPTALGPNTLSKNTIKARSITGSMIDVSNLEAVQTKTGSLTVDGNLTIATGGSLRSGKTSYSDVANGGYYIGIDSGVPKIRVGNIGGSAGFTWDGTSLDIKGAVTATSGSIAGWTIGTTDLQGSGGVIGLASSGSIRIWSGSATPSSAPFRVDSAGSLTSTSGSIGGWTIDSLGIRLGSSTSERGMDTGSIAFYAGGSPASAPFRVSTTGNLTATNATLTGAITASSLSITGTASFAGGSMTLPNGGSITSSTVDLNQGTLSGLTVDGDITLGASGRILWNSTNSKITSSAISLRSAGSYADAFEITNSVGTSVLSLQADSGLGTIRIGGSAAAFIQYTSGTLTIRASSTTGGVKTDGNGVSHFGVLYPGSGSGSGQTSYYIGHDSTDLYSNTGHINLTAIASRTPGNSSSVAAWMELKINGTAYSVPLYS